MSTPSPERLWSRLVGDGAVRLDGFHAVKHALRFGAEVPLILTADRGRALELATALAPDVAGALHKAVEADAATIARLAGVAHHTGVAALAMPRDWQLRDVTAASPVVLLDRPRDPGNYGAVIRVAAGLGAAGVLSSGPLDPWHPAVIRGAAGLHYALPVRRVDADELDGLGRPVVALDATGADARDAVIPDHAVIAFGSERHGLSAAVAARAGTVLALPMRPGVASYNLATAVAMVLYQWSTSGHRAALRSDR